MFILRGFKYCDISCIHLLQLLSNIFLTQGASLYDLLGKEVDLRERRANVLARQLEVVEVEQALKASLRGVEEETKVRDG